MATREINAQNRLKIKINNLPDKPGCYLFKNQRNEVLYIGKAISLKKRVKSYWLEKKGGDPIYNQKIRDLVASIFDFDIFLVENESEALILENELIKKYKPLYNAMLKDDKSFPWVQITNEKFPRIKIIRKPEDHGLEHEYLGPFVSIGKLKKILRFIRKIFPYCNCNTNHKRENCKRPCTYYQINLCPAPCFDYISTEEYKKNIKKVKQMLLGEIDKIENYLKKKMDKASNTLDFEKAAIWRDRLESLRIFTQKQSILLYDSFESIIQINDKKIENEKIIWKKIDITASIIFKKLTGLIILHVRNGRLIGKTPYIINTEEKFSQDSNFYMELFKQHYLRNGVVKPDEIVLGDKLPNSFIQSFKQSLIQGEKKKENINLIKIRYPDNNEQLEGLVRIAKKNINLLVKQKEEYAQYSQKFEMDTEIINTGLIELKEILNLKKIPIIMEAFDMSHFQGTDYVGSKVSFLEGKPNKAEYRRYKIKKNIGHSDDIAAMKEVLFRRFTSLKAKNEAPPDLIIVDGGLDQLKIANEILKSLDLDSISHVGIAKPEGRSEINSPPKLLKYSKKLKEEIPLILGSPSLHILQHIRNESHRFAIKYHKKLREKRNKISELDKISGIGPAKRKKLLQYYGSIENIKNSNFEEISKLVGNKIAKSIIKFFEILK